MSRRIQLINIGILVLYTVLVLLSRDTYWPLGLALLIIAHTALLLVSSLVYLWGLRKKEVAKALLASAGWVLLIGFSSCFGGAYIIEN